VGTARLGARDRAWLHGLVPALLVMIGGIVMLIRSPMVTGHHRRAAQE